jgi:hypothetical protein
MRHYLRLGSPSQLGFATSLGACTSVVLLCALFEILIPQSAGLIVQTGAEIAQMRFVILYAASAGSEILICTFGALFLLARLSSEEPRFELRRILIAICISFTIIVLIVLIACYLDISVVWQSYHQTVLPLQQDSRLGFLLDIYSVPLLHFEFQVLAVLPLSLVFFGVAFSIVACFWASHQAVDFVRKSGDLQRRDITKLKRGVFHLTSLLSVVFTVSCISTISFLQIGRDWIEADAARATYIQNAYAMSIFWSVCYSSIILGILLIPLFWAGGRLVSVGRQAKHAGGPRSFYEQLFDMFSYGAISKVGAAAIMPILTSSAAALIGS